MKYDDVFQHEYQYTLESISFQQQDGETKPCTVNLEAADSVEINRRNSNGIRFVVKRSIRFSPNILFSMSICFSATLQMRPSADRDLPDAELINLVCEDKASFLPNLLSRIALLCAEITSIYGQQPLVFPPTLILPSKGDS